MIPTARTRRISRKACLEECCQVSQEGLNCSQVRKLYLFCFSVFKPALCFTSIILLSYIINPFVVLSPYCLPLERRISGRVILQATLSMETGGGGGWRV